MQIAPAIAALVALEQKVSEAAAEADPKDEMRIYEWRPHGPPELPAIWNWIDDGTYEIVDTARGDDIIVVTATIAVKPSNVDESMGRLVKLADIFRSVVDPALWRNGRNPPLSGTVKQAKRVVTRTSIEEFDGMFAMCMDMLIRLELSQILG
jgi:hypothetical protein